ncbi:MAG: MBL fold metallo-hydrolase, partial [Alphaproteobacteria bacterium]
MRLSFHGAAHEVTGSCHLLECAGLRILIDCGLFQGGHHVSAMNHAAFGFDPAAMDFLLLTHAHLDHCGRIPLLAKRGFRGEIITTRATRDLCKLVLLDAAHIQEEDAAHASRHRHRHGEAPVAPLFAITDALRSFDFLGRNAGYDEPVQLNEQVAVRFL